MVATFAGPVGHIITALQIFVTATSYSAETNPDTRSQYSKFSRAASHGAASTWPSRLAMLVIYALAAVVAAVLATLRLRDADSPRGVLRVPPPTLSMALCAIHFAKRCLEVSFLHKYSGRTDRATPTMISVYYSLTVLLIARAGNDGNNDQDCVVRVAVGSCAFVLGLLGNLYHHYLLASLRSSSSRGAKSKYVAPR
jgi:hypothetical protein